MPHPRFLPPWTVRRELAASRSEIEHEETRTYLQRQEQTPRSQRPLCPLCFWEMIWDRARDYPATLEQGGGCKRCGAAGLTALCRRSGVAGFDQEGRPLPAWPVHLGK